jgi:3-deoxy-D-manno-octulosonate 8-phosphate phosphatase (KDO 8-P phosphatase)
VIDFPEQLRERAAAIRLVVFDVDGVLTDGRITYTTRGDETKSFNVQDGAAIKMMIAAGIEVAIITGRSSPMVERRAAELGIRHLHQGSDDKAATFARMRTALGLEASACAHVGDDLADLELFGEVGLAFSVPNGHPTVQASAHWVTTARGGEGVAREICQLLLTGAGRWPYE